MEASEPALMVMVDDSGVEVAVMCNEDVFPLQRCCEEGMIDVLADLRLPIGTYR